MLKNYTTPCLHYNVTSLQGVDTKVPVLCLMPYIIWRFPVYSRRAHREQWVLLTQKKTSYRRTFRRNYVNVLTAALWSCVFVRVHTHCVCLCVSVWRTRQEFLPFKSALPFPTGPQRERRIQEQNKKKKLKLAAKKWNQTKNCKGDKYIAITIFINHLCFSPSTTVTPCVNKPMTPYSLTCCLQVIIQNKK